MREVHHFCTLAGYGVDAICPYLAYEALDALKADGKLPAELSQDQLVDRYIKSVGVGILKVGIDSRFQHACDLCF